MTTNNELGMDLLLFNPESDELFTLIDKVDYVYLYNIIDYQKNHSKDGRAYLADMADFFHIPISKVSRRVRKLEERGYVIWKMDESRERTYIEPSKMALELLKEQRNKINECERMVQERIPDSDVEITKSTLRKIHAIIHDEFADDDDGTEE